MTAFSSRSTVIPKRVFLGWEQLPLPSAAARLVNLFRRDHTLDLGNVMVVLPGQRAGRRLVELLVDAAAREGLVLTPPERLTEGSLPEKLYPQRRPLASPLLQRLAWTAAIRELSAEDLAVLFPHPIGKSEYLRWFRLGELIEKVDTELAAEGLDVQSVLEAGREMPGFADRARWEVLHKAKTGYLLKLDALGYADRHTARLAALAKREISTTREIILLGTVDLNAIVRRMLSEVAERVTAFIVAPEAEADRFDPFGQLRIESWQSEPLPIREDQIRFVGGPAEQAGAAAAWLGDLDADFPVEDVAIGVPDPTLVPAIRRRLAQDGYCVRWLEERTLADTAPFRLLAAAADYLRDRGYAAFAALARHPDLEAWLRAQGTPLDPARLDEHQAQFFPARIDATRLPSSAAKGIQDSVGAVERWLNAATRTRPLSQWAGTFAALLKPIYAVRGELDLDRDPDRALHAALLKILDGLEKLRDIPTALDLLLSAAEAFAVAFDATSAEPIPPPIDPGAIELLGWLELALDDAAAVLVLSFNEGFVPSGSPTDPFLPDTLRAKLDIEHDASRYARDAYATIVLAHSKKQFGCVVARRDSEQNPLNPSRFLFACEEKSMLDRLRRWRAGDPEVPAARGDTPRIESPFRVPAARKRGQKRDRFRVTEFRDILACPYRYYLRHVEDLSSIDDAARELDGGRFGSLLHHALRLWGNDAKWRDCMEAGALEKYLLEQLQEVAATRYHDCWPALRLQVAQAERRLKAFARGQARLATAGWRVVFAEREGESLTCRFGNGSNGVELSGRIDRIDYHREKNVVRILDYKTSDEAKTPEKTHEKSGEWIDLQLPLYRHLWRGCGGFDFETASVEVHLGYFQLSSDPKATGVVIAEEWNEERLNSADEKARELIALVRAEEFGEPRQPPPLFFEEFAAICLDGQRPPALRENEDENGGEE